MARQAEEEDAWGSDFELELSSSGTSGAPHAKRVLPGTSLGDPPPNSECSPIHSLRVTCLGVVAKHLDELLEYGEDVLPWLPPDIRASLMAVARRQGLVKDETLNLFVDASWVLFDVSGTSLSFGALEKIAEGMAGVRAIDVSDCKLGPQTLAAFARHCPLVEILRLRNVNLSVRNCLDCLASILPCVVTGPGESWEDDADEQSTAGRWGNLKYIVWPGIPAKVESFINDLTPKVMVISSMQTHSEQNLPPFANPGMPLDLALLEDVGAEAWGEDDPGSDCQSLFSSSGASARFRQESGELMSIAEKFRLAYVEIDARKAAKCERNYKQRKRREAKKSQAAQALAQWLDAE
ncbi:hypothetical protein BSKO_05383 [Bryopsis sp. KO-2023]|nr:hypothetical protein BSKO_05383 [Bryopsis sp. KO-2023]